MSELYDAIRRIQELEKQVHELTKRAEDAEFSAKALRANNKDLQAELREQLKAPASIIPSVVFASRHSVSDFDEYETTVGSYLHNMLMDSFKYELAETLVADGYVKDLTITTQHNPRERTTEYRLEGKINITK